MSTLDGIIRELAQRFGLGDRAGPLVSAFLSFLTNRNNGGISGFLDRVRQAGLGNRVDSWVGRGPNMELSPGQLEQAIGRDSVDRIAVAAGTTPSIATPALAFLVPKVIDLITPDGVVPTELPAGLASFAGFGAAASDAIGSAGRRTAAATGEVAAAGGSGLKKLIPILALLLLGFLGWQLLGRRSGVDRTAEQTATVSDSVYTEPAAPVDPAATPTTPTPGAEISIEDSRAEVTAAMRRASNALAGLRSGYTGRELVSALNLNIINFASGSAQIPAESRDVLNASATAIKGAPSGTVLEVGGHTDNTGDSAANQQLSTRRAEAVRSYLVRQGVAASALRARGYGFSNPVADNSSESGRFRNRRIEFTVVE